MSIPQQLSGHLETKTAAICAQALRHEGDEILGDNQISWRMPETLRVKSLEEFAS